MYESRIYIVAPTWQRDSKSGKCFAETLAVFNLGYVETLEDATERYRPTNYFVYADDGETEILEDNYGKELRELTVDQLIDELSITDGMAVSRRAAMLLPTLRIIRLIYPKNDIVCLHYGY